MSKDRKYYILEALKGVEITHTHTLFILLFFKEIVTIFKKEMQLSWTLKKTRIIKMDMKPFLYLIRGLGHKRLKNF